MLFSADVNSVGYLQKNNYFDVIFMYYLANSNENTEVNITHTPVKMA